MGDPKSKFHPKTPFLKRSRQELVFFKKMNEVLKDDGIFLLHTIGVVDKPTPANLFIQKYIFPGGFLPSKNSLNKYVSDNGLTIKSYDSYADHYANTLAIWKNEFNRKCLSTKFN